MSPPRRRLSRVEISLLKHLALCAGVGYPVIPPRKLQIAILPLWRLELMDVWYRQSPDGSRPAQFISITVNGARLIDTILHSRISPRLGSSQGQSNGDDQPSEPQQGQTD